MNYAVLRAGNGIVVCLPSKVRLAIFNSSARFSINHLATPALSLCARASSHSRFAALMHCCERFKDASSRSTNDWFEQSSKYSNDGNGTAPCGISGSPVVGIGTVVRHFGGQYRCVNGKSMRQVVDF